MRRSSLPVRPCGQKGDKTQVGPWQKEKAHRAEQNSKCGHFREVPAVFRGCYPSRLCLQTAKQQPIALFLSAPLLSHAHGNQDPYEDPSHCHAKPSCTIPITSYVVPPLEYIERLHVQRQDITTGWLRCTVHVWASLSISSDKDFSGSPESCFRNPFKVSIELAESVTLLHRKHWRGY